MLTLRRDSETQSSLCPRTVPSHSTKVPELSVVHFRDHPDSDMQILHDDLNRRFVFDPPLREGYILFYIKNSLRTTRYMWRKLWSQQDEEINIAFALVNFFPH
ncbi:hypothetical protein M758_UG205700 [Ceratodon purpureus]|nr:hypothetical protein M758_UG205700 [Ceratodon purpureus]